MLAQPPRPGVPGNPLIRFAMVTVLTGIGAGLGGMALALLLHFIQHVAYGYSITQLVGHESFYEGVVAASAGRRVAVLVLCGLVAGCGWFVIYRYGRPLVSIKKAVSSDDPRMPPVTTTAHALLQIITVALGSPLGREVAPREIGSLLAGWLSHYAGLTVEQTRLMVACGAGAGLAAVYNVPFGGAIFVLEVLLRSFELRVVIPALVTSVIAAVVAWLGLGDESQYVVPHFGEREPRDVVHCHGSRIWRGRVRVRPVDDEGPRGRTEGMDAAAFLARQLPDHRLVRGVVPADPRQRQDTCAAGLQQ